MELAHAILITTEDQLDSFASEWDHLVNRCGSSPALLRPYVKFWMHLHRVSDRFPLIFVLESGGKFLGVAPLSLSTRFGARYAKQLFEPSLSPDLIVEEENREIFVERLMNYVFRESNTQCLDLVLPSDSPNLRSIMALCQGERRPLEILPSKGHGVIKVDASWHEYARVRGKNFRKHLIELDRKMKRVGKWQIVHSKLDADARAKIEAIERSSWKEQWREKTNSSDDELAAIFETSEESSAIYPDFCADAWILEITDRPVAYSITLDYKGIEFAAKTSFDNQYRSLSPGIFLNTAVVRSVFETRRAQTIDFLTDLPATKRWSSDVATRTRILVTQKGVASAVLPIFSSVVDALGKTDRTRRVQNAILHRL
jgi:CelD/BcsL family acetyltransferase involved in cellulose biosynthesis